MVQLGSALHRASPVPMGGCGSSTKAADDVVDFQSSPKAKGACTVEECKDASRQQKCEHDMKEHKSMRWTKDDANRHIARIRSRKFDA